MPAHGCSPFQIRQEVGCAQASGRVRSLGTLGGGRADVLGRVARIPGFPLDSRSGAGSRRRRRSVVASAAVAVALARLVVVALARLVVVALATT
jgi:hypothetical protein